MSNDGRTYLPAAATLILFVWKRWQRDPLGHSSICWPITKSCCCYCCCHGCLANFSFLYWGWNTLIQLFQTNHSQQFVHVSIISITPHQVQLGLPAAATPRCITGASPSPRVTTVALNDVEPSVQLKSVAPSLRSSRRPLLLLLFLLFQQSPLNVLPTLRVAGGRLRRSESVAPTRRVASEVSRVRKF